MSLPENICREIVSLVPNYELLPWIDPKKLSHRCLSSNPSSGAIDFLKANSHIGNVKDKINLKALSENPNPKALVFLREKLREMGKDEILQQLNWHKLAIDPRPEALEVLKYCINRNAYPPKLWQRMAKSPHDEAIAMVKSILNVSNNKAQQPLWEGLSENPNPKAVKILKENPDKIIWSRFVKNTNPEAIALLKQNLHKILPVYYVIFRAIYRQLKFWLKIPIL